MRRARGAVEQGQADKALKERALLFRRYRAARKAHRDSVYANHPLGPELRFFANHLTRYKQLEDATAMLAYVREHTHGWLSVAPPDIRTEALSIVGENIMRIRLHAGLAPFNDPLPGEANDVFQLIKRELA
jgi:hypothetical protein